MVGYRNTKFPYDNWRTADPGHIHYKWRLMMKTHGIGFVKY